MLPPAESLDAVELIPDNWGTEIRQLEIQQSSGSLDQP
jgi:hypothetical protein